jgi:hypothetical protein
VPTPHQDRTTHASIRSVPHARADGWISQKLLPSHSRPAELDARLDRSPIWSRLLEKAKGRELGSAGRRGRGRHGEVFARGRRRDGCVVRRLGAGTLTDLAQSLETRAHSLPAIPGKEYVPSFCIACSPSVDPTRPCLAVGSRDYSLTA